MMLDAREAMYAWTPSKYDDGKMPPGSILIDRWPDPYGWSDPYLYTAGACFTRQRSLDDKRLAYQLLFDFHSMVVRDGIDPMEAHKEFLKIRQYRECIALNIEGAIPKEA